MILPQQLLDQLLYYDYRHVNRGYSAFGEHKGHLTIITLHFNQWWKLPKKLKFDYVVVERTAKMITSQPDPEALQLQNQLDKYFSIK